VFDHAPAVEWLSLSLAANLRTVLQADPDRSRWSELDPDMTSLFEWVEATATPTTTLEVQDLAHLMNLRLVDLFHKAPILLTPTVAGQTPFQGAFGTVHGVEDANWVRFTYPFNLTRSPAGTVCAGFTADGMPVGLQVVGPQHGDLVVLRMLAHLEKVLEVDTVCPV
jgi:Asp-tRNA(Asn)/Glu-tRNA(Gln) amidotransferase A subunit family amidase